MPSSLTRFKQNRAIYIAVRPALSARIRPEQEPQHDFRDRREVSRHGGRLFVADNPIHDAIVADGPSNDILQALRLPVWVEKGWLPGHVQRKGFRITGG
jgi:hypothetical protein